MACGIARLLDGIEFLRLTGIRGVTAGALAAVAVPLYFVHSGPPPAARRPPATSWPVSSSTS
ncbi:hypothetical protein [Streptomyces virginiae]|uniref:hypothetical protein n=1 Tax=Streptomyces virginiae TaxID=1961 RepID=UPI003647A24A